LSSHASPFYLAYRGQCLCYSGQFICAKPDQSKGGKKDKVIGRTFAIIYLCTVKKVDINDYLKNVERHKKFAYKFLMIKRKFSGVT
jgi:hypothetical protein